MDTREWKQFVVGFSALCSDGNLFLHNMQQHCGRRDELLVSITEFEKKASVKNEKKTPMAATHGTF